MKKLLFLLGLYTPLLFGAAEFDLRKGIDLTLTNYVNGSMLNQLVDAGLISATNKGGIIRRPGLGGAFWPDVSGNSRYTNFLWIDNTTYPPALKTYVPTGDAYSNWVVSTVAPGTIGTAQIADWSITDTKLATNSVSDFAIKASAVSGNKIADNGIIAGKLAANSVSKGVFAFGAIFGGDITNKTITFSNIADGTISWLQIADNGIFTRNITNFSITMDKIGTNSIGPWALTNGAITTASISNNSITTNLLLGDINSGLLNTNASYGLARAWATVDGNGTLLKGFNIASTSRRNTGNYTIFFGGNFVPSSTNYVACATGSRVTGGLATSTYSNTTLRVCVNTQGVDGTDFDQPFTIVIYDF